MRRLRGFLARWRILLAGCFAVYCLVLYLPLHRYSTDENQRSQSSNDRPPRRTIIRSESRDALKTEDSQEEEKRKEKFDGYEFTSNGGPSFFVDEVMTDSSISLEERVSCKADKAAPPRLILSWNAGHGQEHLGGCPDWNCKLVHDRKLLDKADAVLIAFHDPGFRRRDDQYVIYFSQESPANSGYSAPYLDFFNMSLGFRHDTPAASPYGYTVKLAPKSQPEGELISMSLVNGKSKGAAWFVSHCGTNSRRETYVDELKKYFPVDIYGRCGSLKCDRGGACEKMLDVDYHFYIAFENSICKNYITEKLWNQGYLRDIVPLVLKRSVVEPFVPPNSFIAADDFSDPKDLAAHLHYLMNNKTAYAEYFSWRREYKVVFLNGHYHDGLERPWGFCQVCRLLWEKPRKRYSIENFETWWKQSCEDDGQLVNRLLGSTRNSSSPSSSQYD